MEEIHVKIGEFQQLLAGREWNADISWAAVQLFETIQERLGESDERVKAWDQELKQRNDASRAGSSSRNSTAVLPVLPLGEPAVGAGRAIAEPPRSTPAAGPHEEAPATSVENVSMPIGTVVPTELLNEPGFFGAALQDIAKTGRFILRQKLQTGHFGTGYEALDRQSGQRVVVKLPAQHAWEARFDECADALTQEASLLTAITPVIAAARPEHCAQSILHVAQGTIQVAGWPRPIPWIAQTFARGQRISEQLPMRDDREPDALRILVQVTGMVRQLYTRDFAHRDLKQDCLFWEAGRQVEVIDWNRATSAPSAGDKEQEFAALQRLTSAVLLGPLFQWSGSGSYSYDLLVAFRGTPLSRGTRLLLARLLDPYHPLPIRNVDDLHAALREVLAFWDEPLGERPVLEDTTPQALSLLLNRLSVETQRPAALSPVAASSIEWQIAGQGAAQADIQKRVRVWLANRAALRTATRRIEEPWPWLPDIWPLNWLIPLTRTWFKHLGREHDAALADLASVMVANQWDQIVAQTQQLAAAQPAPLPSILQSIRRVAAAYQMLEQAEQLLRMTPPDYAAALNTLTSVREVLPLEPRLARITQQLDAGTELAGRISRLHNQIAQLRNQEPDSRAQRALLQLLDELRTLRINDPRYVEQQQHVALVDEAERAINQAHGLLSHHDAPGAERILKPWIEQAELRAIAPDLARQTGDLATRIGRRVAQEQIDQLFGQLRQALMDGHLGAATGLFQQVRLLVNVQPSRLSELSLAEIDRLNDMLPKITALWQAVERGDAAEAQPLDTAAQPAVALPLVWALNELVNQSRALGRAKDLGAVMDAYAAITAQPEPHAAGVAPLRASLRSAALIKLEQVLRTTLENNAVRTEQQFLLCQSAREQLRAGYGERAELGYLDRLLERRGEVRLATAIERLEQKVGATEARLSTTADAQVLTAGINSLKDHLIKIKSRLDSQNAKPTETAGIEARAVPVAQTPPSSVDANSRQGPSPTPVGSRAELRPPALAPSKAQEPGSASVDPWAKLRPPALAPSDTQDTQSIPAYLMTTIGAWGRKRIPVLAAGVLLVALLAITAPLVMRRLGNRVAQGSTTTAIAPSTTVQAGVATAIAPSPVSKPSSIATQPSETPAVSSPVPAPASVAVEPQSAALNERLTLKAPGIGQLREVRVQIVSATVTLTPTTIASDTLEILLPERLFETESTAFNLPHIATLLLSPAYGPATVSISDTAVTVRGVGAGSGDDVYIGSTIKGVYLWKNPQRGDPDNNAEKPTGREQPKEYVLLQDGDLVRILGGTGDMYRVRVETNGADKEFAIGKEGWVRKSLIHGP